MASLVLKVVHARKLLKHLNAPAKVKYRHWVVNEMLFSNSTVHKKSSKQSENTKPPLHTHLDIVFRTVLNTQFTSLHICVCVLGVGGWVSSIRVSDVFGGGKQRLVGLLKPPLGNTK